MSELWPGRRLAWRCRRPPGAFGKSEGQEVWVLAEGSPSASLWGMTGRASLAGGSLREVRGGSRRILSCRRVGSRGSSAGVWRPRGGVSGAFILSGLEPDLPPDCWGCSWESRCDQRVPPGPCRGAVSMGTGEKKSMDPRSPTLASPLSTMVLTCVPPSPAQNALCSPSGSP